MSSAENDTHTGRLVWITAEQRNELAMAYDAMPDGGSSPPAFREVVDGWDAAPDPDAALRSVIAWLPMLNQEGIDTVAKMAAVALGVPGDTPNKTHNPTKQD